VSFGVVETDAGVCADAASATHDVKNRTREPERTAAKLAAMVPIGNMVPIDA